MKYNLIETIVGVLVLLLSAAFFSYAYFATSNDHLQKGYILQARFQNADGIVKGSDVAISGIRVGKVESVKLDPGTFVAVIEFKLRKDVLIPIDSTAGVVSSGFLGSKFITITPGASEQYLSVNEFIKYTQPSMNIESLVNKFFAHSLQQKEK